MAKNNNIAPAVEPRERVVPSFEHITVMQCPNGLYKMLAADGWLLRNINSQRTSKRTTTTKPWNFEEVTDESV
jgi:hypothetical protein